MDETVYIKLTKLDGMSVYLAISDIVVVEEILITVEEEKYNATEVITTLNKEYKVCETPDEILKAMEAMII